MINEARASRSGPQGVTGRLEWRIGLLPALISFRRPTLTWWIVLGPVLLIALGVPSAIADVSIDSDAEFEAVSIRGEIRWADIGKIQSLDPNPLRIWVLNSPGGDVYAAMEIGRLIRTREGDVVVPVSGRCLSSCALLYVAGVSRNNYGRVGLHRPYLVDQPKSSDKIEKSLPRMFSEIRAYVHEMGATREFADIIINTPPDDVRIFKGTAIEQLVPVDSPLHEEIRISGMARKHGITTEEYRRRELEAQDCHRFGVSVAYLECRNAILWGLSISVYKSRRESADVSCRISDAVWNQIDSWEDRHTDHPAYVESEKCEIEIMAGKLKAGRQRAR